jgi:hypothetical protein
LTGLSVSLRPTVPHLSTYSSKCCKYVFRQDCFF